MTNEYCVVLTTTQSKESVRTIVHCVLERKLAACVQVVPIESHYSWQGEVVQDGEFLLLLKAKSSDYRDLEAAIRSVHPYEIPEIVSLGVENGSSDYLDWIKATTR